MRQGFRRFDPVIQGRLLRRCMEAAGGLKDVERIHIRILSELMDRQTGSQADLPGGRKARREYQGIRLEKKEAAGKRALGGRPGKLPGRPPGRERSGSRRFRAAS